MPSSATRGFPQDTTTREVVSLVRYVRDARPEEAVSYLTRDDGAGLEFLCRVSQRIQEDRAKPRGQVRLFPIPLLGQLTRDELEQVLINTSRIYRDPSKHGSESRKAARSFVLQLVRISSEDTHRALLRIVTRPIDVVEELRKKVIVEVEQIESTSE